jgi:hypothetical protein
MALLMVHVFYMHGDPHVGKKLVCLMNIEFHVYVNREITRRLAVSLHNVDGEILYTLF